MRIISFITIFLAFTAYHARAGEAPVPDRPAAKAAPVDLNARVVELVDNLGDSEETVRKQAEADLKNLGVAAVKPLAKLIEQGEYAGQRKELKNILSVILSEYLEELALGVTSETTDARREFAALGRSGIIGLRQKAGGPDGKVKQLALEIIGELVRKYIEDLDSVKAPARDEAVAALYELGPYAVPELDSLLKGGPPPGVEFLARRVLRMIKFRISPTLFLKTGTLLEGYENASWRKKRDMINFLERHGGPDAGDALKAIVEMEEDEKVREFAGMSLVRVIHGEAIPFLVKHGLSGLKALPAITRGIHMDQGVKYLTNKMYEKAEREFRQVLKDFPKDDTAWYNLACTYSLWGKIEEAVDAFAKSVEYGFDDVNHIENDGDLDNIRDHPVYRRIIRNLRTEQGLPLKPDRLPEKKTEPEKSSGPGPGPPPPPEEE